MRNPILFPAFVAAAVIALGPWTHATAAEPPAVPVLKGSYVYTQVKNCVKKAGVLDQESGTVVFNPQKGIYKTDGYSVSGDPLTLTQVTGKTVYSNTESTLTLGEFTFQAAYGKLQNGIATYLSAITVVGSCGYQIWFSRQ